MASFRTGRLAVAAVGAVGVVAGSSSPASASNLGSTPIQPDGGAVSFANNRWHSYAFVGNVSDLSWQKALDDAVYSSYQPTDLEVSRYANGSTNVDVQISVDWYNTGWYGATFCPAGRPGVVITGTDPTRACYGQVVKIDTRNQPAVQDQRKSIMCHEFGHTLGLRHAGNTANSCMRVPDFPVALNQHDVDQLNWIY